MAAKKTAKTKTTAAAKAKKAPTPAHHAYETECVHRGVKVDTLYKSATTPIYPTSTFEFAEPGKAGPYDYTRSGNPTRSALEANLAQLEGGTSARATCTGMSAISTLTYMWKAGDHIITGNDIYGGTHRLFTTLCPRHGVEVSFVNMRDPKVVEKAIKKNTKAIWIETPSNPLLNIVDLEAIAKIAKKHKLMTFIDNTFLGPMLQKPFDYGIDVIVHSTTKYINGHSDVVGGAIITRDKKIDQEVAFLVNALGTACSPWDAFLVLRGVKTMPMRMKAHVENAAAIAEYLDGHKKVAHVYYPGLKTHPEHELAKRQMLGMGGMVSFDIKGGLKAGEKFVGALEIFTLAESLGGVESLIEMPYTMSHTSMSVAARREAGIKPGNIRCSIGIENPDDLIRDMERAFAKVG
ncbi:MAG: PLP-dependent transferase [Deltaproteobacteria bacterium]|nr:PLP-dependent transferase [Deltaproteobacteria bacterium]